MVRIASSKDTLDTSQREIEMTLVGVADLSTSLLDECQRSPDTDCGVLPNPSIFVINTNYSQVSCIHTVRKVIRTEAMNSTKVQNPRRKMQVALLAEPKTPPGVERVYIIL